MAYSTCVTTGFAELVMYVVNVPLLSAFRNCPPAVVMLDFVSCSRPVLMNGLYCTHPCEVLHLFLFLFKKINLKILSLEGNVFKF